MKKRISLSLITLILLNCINLCAQSKQPIIWWNMTWNGLRVQQPLDEMPKGKAPFQVPERKTKIKKTAEFKQLQSNVWELASGWEMIEAYKTREATSPIFDPNMDTKDWYNAVVPGTVLSALVDAGIYPDPYYGLNNLAITDTLCRMDWWYRIAFETPEQTKNKITKILFNGINYMAEVYINNKMLGTIRGAFIRGEFDITPYLKSSGKNVLAVRIIPPFNPGIPHEQSMVSGQGLNGGQLCMDGPTFISSEGWDWVPGIRDRNIGIWQDVRLQTYSKVEIKDPYIITDLPLPDTSKANITLRAEVVNLSKESVTTNLKGAIKGTDLRFEQNVDLKAGESKIVEFNNIEFKNPKLWWPNNYGEPNLYNLELTAEANNNFSDRKQVTFGVREFSYELMIAKDKSDFRRVEMNPIKALEGGKPIFDVVNRVEYKDKNYLPALAKNADYNRLSELDQNDPVGPFLILKVNGVRIFARGGNWGMDDAMKNTSRTKMEPYFKLHRNENFNIVRNWTGESTDETFYTLADEYGMLVWNDFWMTTENSNTDPNDHTLFVENAVDAVKRFRNHASIAIWCPRNEGFAPIELENRLMSVCSDLDQTRMYHGQSRFLNMGDSGPWGYFSDPAYYHEKRAKGFNTEMGNYAIPTANTIRKFIAPEDLWPINDVWAYHDLHHTTQNFKGFMEAVESYGKPTSMEDFVRKAHRVNYDSWRSMVEAWNSKMWDDCTGLILWMSHPAWPSMIWQTYTWDYETPAAFFGAKKASEPLHIQMNPHNARVIVVNASRFDAGALTASLKYYDMNGKLISQIKPQKVDVKRNSKTECFDAPSLNLTQTYLTRLELMRGKELISVNDYWGHGTSDSQIDNSAFDKLDKVTLIGTISKKGNKATITIQNKGKQIAVGVKLNLKDNKSKEIILPAYFSDGYFNLLPNESRKIELELPAHYKSQDFCVVAEGYNIGENSFN